MKYQFFPIAIDFPYPSCHFIYLNETHFVKSTNHRVITDKPRYSFILETRKSILETFKPTSESPMMQNDQRSFYFLSESVPQWQSSSNVINSSFKTLSQSSPSNCISHLDYCISQETRFPTSSSSPLQSILQTATRLFLKCRSDYATQLLNLQWLLAAFQLYFCLTAATQWLHPETPIRINSSLVLV